MTNQAEEKQIIGTHLLTIDEALEAIKKEKRKKRIAAVQKYKGLQYRCPKCDSLYSYAKHCEDCGIDTVRINECGRVDYFDLACRIVRAQVEEVTTK